MYGGYLNISPVSEILACAGLEEPTLAALIPNEANYRVLLMQPQGVIEINNSVRNQDRDLARKQFRQFLLKAQKSDASLVITPEYSMPWETLMESIKAGIIPSQGNIWVLGCESIKYSELNIIKQQSSPFATILYEPLNEPLDANLERFVCPLAYVFLALPKNGDTVPNTVILVQFKTCSMSDDNHFEVNGMQLGSVVYQFGGTEQQLKLISLICSDVIDFYDKEAKDHFNNALILHIQLTHDPRHEVFLRCRRRLLGFKGDTTEIICLNWAAGIRQFYNGQYSSWNNISGSAWYIKSREFDERDEILCTNHQRGLYYTWFKTHQTHALFFNFAPAIYLLTSTKVAHIGVIGSGPKRRGPQLEQTCYWNDTTGTWIEQKVTDDGFSNVIGESGSAKEELLDIASRSPIEVERILALATGNIEDREDWHKTRFLDSCIIEASEVIKRITFAQDTDQQAKQFREVRLKRFGHLWDILKDGSRLPPALADFKNGFSFECLPESFHQNAISDTGKRATVIYMGEDSSDSRIEAVAKRVAEYLNRSITCPNECHDAKQRLAIWFRSIGGEINLYDHTRFTKYNEPGNISEFEIVRQE